MMKTQSFWIVSIFAFLISAPAVAQFNKGDKLLNIGVGANSYFYRGIPLHTSFEVGVTEEFSIGASFDFVGGRYRSGGINYPYTATYIGGRGSFHLTELLDLNAPEFDLYAGVSLGFRSFWWTGDDFNGLNDYDNGLYYGLFAGGRYYFDKRFGVFGEAGVGYSGNLRLGVAFRL